MHPLRNRQFRWLFAAQVLSLLGVGILTVALALTAYRLGGVDEAGKILGLILALKMIAYVALAPLAEVGLSGVRPRTALLGLNCLRMLLLLPMAFTDEVGWIAALAFLFFAVSAAFTPLYQATIPALLVDEKSYAKALSLSRLAYSLEGILSPVLAGLALAVLASSSLFPLAAGSFALSVAALYAAGLNLAVLPEKELPFLRKLSRGILIELRTPRLRGLLTMNLALSLGLSWVIVNSVVFAGDRFGGEPTAYTALMAGYGTGAAIAALSVPPLLERVSERLLMFAGCVLFAAVTPMIWLPVPLWGFVPLWALLGAAASLVMTPGGLVLNRSAAPEDRPALFAAQFSLSHAAWLLAYPLAGWLAASFGIEWSLIALGAAAGVIACIAKGLWPADDPLERPHSHANLQSDHPHLREVVPLGPGKTHQHQFFHR